jgi:hypothetical protein
MRAYESAGFQPAAPIAYVKLLSQDRSLSITNVPMLLDTGADVSLVPRDRLIEILATSVPGQQYTLQGFDGQESSSQAIHLELHFLGKIFRGQFLLVEGTHGILGRNILNRLALTFNGPALMWHEVK